MDDLPLDRGRGRGPLIAAQREQIFVAGHEIVGLAFLRTGEKYLVLGIATNAGKVQLSRHVLGKTRQTDH
jgi:hypothetical protein